MSTAAQLIVASDPLHSEALCAYLSGFRFGARASAGGTALFEQLERQHADLVVLDLRLTHGDLGLLRALRAASGVPIILLGDSDSATDRIVGLEMGADDCLDRPFLKRELVARIQTVLRRTRGGAGASVDTASADLIRFDGWELQRSERRLRSPAGCPVALSNAEFRLLDTFLKTPRRVVSRDQLASQARGCAAGEVARSIDLLVSRLRQKLAAAAGDPALIQTVRGMGYRFDARSVERAVAGVAA